MIRAHIIVSGYVQGVGYRAFVLKTVKLLNNKITGWVRNLPDGSKVEIIAEGLPGSIDILLSKLWEGPFSSKVENIEIHKEEIKEKKFNDFNVIF